jgi:nucleoid-associated protein YgaU
MFFKEVFLMRAGVMIFFLVLAVSVAPSFSSNAYLAGSTYETTHVKSGDTLWDIASRYSTEKDDIRQLTYAIREINKLNENAQIYPGQTVKIPVRNTR